jgi:hypothetical protein
VSGGFFLEAVPLEAEVQEEISVTKQCSLAICGLILSRLLVSTLLVVEVEVEAADSRADLA